MEFSDGMPGMLFDENDVFSLEFADGMPGMRAVLLSRANLTGPVLGCIEAKFCKKICV